ncbi:hypothetical protein LIER_43474 [Lithospermum erythrorhizon]|uniref:Uncharacterized protein n=1 Tax=Lithospermum erythrorhizon TaxID=34254 RepID=A0AAV3Q771_LITER
MVVVTKKFRAIYFLLTVLSCSHESVLVEGRQLKASTDHKNDVPHPSMQEKRIHNLGHEAINNGKNGEFRPTNPGHNPGIGHSHSESETNVVSSGRTYSATGRTDDFRPTTPGHSPGVGHNFQKSYNP